MAHKEDIIHSGPREPLRSEDREIWKRAVCDSSNRVEDKCARHVAMSKQRSLHENRRPSLIIDNDLCLTSGILAILTGLSTAIHINFDHLQRLSSHAPISIRQRNSSMLSLDKFGTCH